MKKYKLLIELVVKQYGRGYQLDKVEFEYDPRNSKRNKKYFKCRGL